VKGLKLLESRIQLRSCYKADILNGGEKLDMIFESSVYKNEHESACRDISRLISSKLHYSPWWGLIPDKGAKEEHSHPAGIVFKRHKKQTETKWIRGSNVVTLIKEMEADGRAFYTVKVLNKRLEGLLNGRSRIAPFSEILDTVTEYLNACDQISSQFQFVEGVFDRNPAGERCLLQDHKVDKCYEPQASPKNRDSQLIEQALRRCQTIDNNQTPTQKGIGCDVGSGAETSDLMTGNANETMESDCAGSDGPLVNFSSNLYKARSGEFYDIMGAQDSALPGYPPLLPSTPTSGRGMGTTRWGLESAPARPASDSSKVVSRHSFGETSSGNSPSLPTNFLNTGPKYYVSNGDTGRTGEIGFGDLLHAPRVGGGENKELVATCEAVTVKDGFTTDQPTVGELRRLSHGFISSKDLRRDAQEREKLTGTTHGQSTKLPRGWPEHTGTTEYIPGHTGTTEYIEAILSGGRLGSLPDGTITDRVRPKDHLSIGYGANSAQRQAESTGTPSCTERASTPHHPSDGSSTDFEIPVGLGEELCELEKEIFALNKAAGLV